MLALDIGSGPIHRQLDFADGITVKPLRLDIRAEVHPDLRADAQRLPFADGTFDIVFSSHVLEHFPRAQFEPTISEWLRVLKPSGELWLLLPNITWAAERLTSGILDEHVLNVLYGEQSNPFDFHYNGLTPERMQVALAGFGWEIYHLAFQNYHMAMRTRRRTEHRANETI